MLTPAIILGEREVSHGDLPRPAARLNAAMRGAKALPEVRNFAVIGLWGRECIGLDILQPDVFRTNVAGAAIGFALFHLLQVLITLGRRIG